MIDDDDDAAEPDDTPPAVVVTVAPGVAANTVATPPDVAPVIAVTPMQLVNPQPYFETLTSVGRSIALVIGSATAIAGFASKHDWNGLASYVQSQPFVLAGSTVLALSTAAWAALSAFKRSHTIATAADNPLNTAIQRK